MNIQEEILQNMSEFFGKFTGLTEFAKVGEGNLDMNAMIEASLEVANSISLSKKIVHMEKIRLIL